MAKEKQTRRMMAMALAAAVTMSSVPVVAFAEESETPTVTTSGEGTVAAPTVTVTAYPTETKTNEEGNTETVDKTTTETQGQDNETGASVDSTVTKTVTTETNAEGNLENTNEKVVTDSNAVDANGVTTDTDITREETVDYNNGVWESTDGYEEGTKVVESTVEDPEDVNVHAVGVPTLPSSGGKTSIDKVEVNGQDVEVKTTVYKEVSEDEATGKRVTTTTTVVTQPKKDKEGNYVFENGAVVMETVTTVDRDVLLSSTGDSDKSDGEWDYTEIETGREVTVTTEKEKIEIFTGNGNTIENVKPIVSVWEGNEQDAYNGSALGNLGSVKLEEKGEFDVAYVGTGEITDFTVGVEVEGGHSLGLTANSSVNMEQFKLQDVQMVPVMVQKLDENNKPVYDENQQPVMVQKVDKNGQPVYEKKAVGEVFSGYCVDLSTTTKDGYWYTIKNLEDAGYYDTTRVYGEDGKTIVKYSDADHIRAIVKNGYWGTPSVGEKDANGNVVEKAATGSLDDVKAALNAAIAAGTLTTLTTEDVAQLTEGEALAATQMAIWNYGNQEDGKITFHLKGNGDNATEAEGAEARARAIAVRDFLISLTDAEEETEIITQDKFIKEMDFVVGDKAAGEAANTDNDDTNDVYNVSLKFALVVTPDENDNLVVKVVDSGNNVITSAKIGGNGGLTPDAEGNYTLPGMKLAENSDIDFDLKLEGTQMLTEGVYIYQSEMRGTTTSQTFVGMASGTKQVDVGAHIDLTFNVEEGTMKATHSWRKTWHDKDDDNGGGGNNGDDDDDDDDDIVTGDDDDEFGDDDDDGVAGDDDDDDEDDGMVAGEEDENAADAEDDGLVAGAEDEIIAATADSNHMAGAGASMFAALAGLFMLGRKKKTN